jgi:hypothetical protein
MPERDTAKAFSRLPLRAGSGRNPGMQGEELYRSGNLVVRRVRGSGAREPATCFVTFGSYTVEYDLERQGFGEDFLRDEGLDAIHVINRDNQWYQYPELPEALAAVATETAKVPRVFTYGSSMGGYAALRFARAVGARTAIAISPQYSLDPRVVPFENRWQADLARITFREQAIQPAVRQIIFYDPRLKVDAQHFALFEAASAAQEGSETVAVGVPHAGHPVGPLLAETGALQEAIRTIVAGGFTPSTVQRAVRERRAASQHHFFMLSRRAGPSRPALRIDLLRRAAAIAPESHILSELGQALDAQGAHDEAGPLHEEAIRKVPSNVRAKIFYAAHLEAVGRAEEGAAVLRAALVGQTGSVRLLGRMLQLRMALRRWHLGAADRLLERFLDRSRHRPAYGRVTRWLGRQVQ